MVHIRNDGNLDARSTGCDGVIAVLPYTPHSLDLQRSRGGACSEHDLEMWKESSRRRVETRLPIDLADDRCWKVCEETTVYRDTLGGLDDRVIICLGPVEDRGAAADGGHDPAEIGGIPRVGALVTEVGGHPLNKEWDLVPPGNGWVRVGPPGFGG